MKAYTDIKQSAQLAVLLPAESADMKFPYFGDGQYGTTALFGEPIEFSGGKDIPAWSLSALLDVYPMVVGRDMDMYCCWQNHKNLHSKHYDNPVDACYEMILMLHELNLL